ncbi:Uncharacterised protein [Vibrio cholerae]|nr:Uncharacterised protein [Vibrio cholerae]
MKHRLSSIFFQNISSKSSKASLLISNQGQRHARYVTQFAGVRKPLLWFSEFS